MTPDTRQKQLLKLSFVAVIIALATFVIYSGALQVSRRGLVGLTVHVIPEDSHIKLDNKTISGGTTYVRPGSYTLTASRQYFATTTKTVQVKASSAPKPIYLLPAPNTREALDYLAKHPDIQQEREKYIAANVNQTQIDLNKKYPILSKLPVNTSDYRIDYSLGSDNTPGFSITLYPIINGPTSGDSYHQQLLQLKNEALKFLQDNGINPAAFTITYTPEV